jgi:hypothetical protein
MNRESLKVFNRQNLPTYLRRFAFLRPALLALVALPDFPVLADLRFAGGAKRVAACAAANLAIGTR